jgi:diguanylate cyclase (GGDEF)-like protein/excisionase family DNA binding protein
VALLAVHAGADALHDPLTGLPNRTLLGRRLDEALADHTDVAVLFLDLDRFKDINDTFGHQAGDELLRRVAERLLGAIDADADADATLARFGGDEFVVVCRDVGGERGAIAIAERLLAALAAPISHRDRQRFVTASIGIVVPDDPHQGPGALLRDADVAMYRAKDAGGDRYALFDRAMRDRILQRVELEHDLRQALERDEFVLEFQPLVGLAEPTIVGAEALVRWEHPRLGLMAPAAFVGVAEETGLIVELGRWVLTEACRRLARWSAEPAIDLPYVSVNLSGRQLAEPDLPEVVAKALRQTGAPADRLVLEVTESVLIGDSASPAAVLQRLKEIGVQLMLDDFGTGYSSLNYVKRFPIDGLKVDRSFVAGITEGPEDRHILAAIVQMAKGLRVQVVAEGVETLEQARWVRALGCDVAQGYLFAPPAPAAALEPLLRQGLPLSRLAPVWAGAPPCDPAPADPAEPQDTEHAADEQTVPLGEAADALGISTSTLRRWADNGRVRAIRTTGGHRRFPVAELQRLKSSTARLSPPALRPTPLPTGPLVGLGALLRQDGPSIAGAAARAIYDGARTGWLSSAEAEPHLERWTRATAAACGGAEYELAVEAGRGLMRQARYAGASLLERQLFVERCGELVLHRLQQRSADRPQLVGARRLFARLRQALAQDAPAGV